MRRTSSAITTAVMIATGLTMGLLPTGIARAGEGSDIQALRREVNRMRAEVEAMQVAITQANDLERVRNDKLRKALGDPRAVGGRAGPGPRPLPAEETQAPNAPRARAAGRARIGRRGQRARFVEEASATSGRAAPVRRGQRIGQAGGRAHAIGSASWASAS